MDTQATILIVDDEPSNVDMLSQELDDEGYHILTASDGEEALIKVQEHPPDIILLDIMMPKVDGFTTCRILKGSGKTILIPIILLTALRSHEDRIKGIGRGPTISSPSRLTPMSCCQRSAPCSGRKSTARSTNWS